MIMIIQVNIISTRIGCQISWTWPRIQRAHCCRRLNKSLHAYMRRCTKLRGRMLQHQPLPMREPRAAWRGLSSWRDYAVFLTCTNLHTPKPWRTWRRHANPMLVPIWRTWCMVSSGIAASSFQESHRRHSSRGMISLLRIPTLISGSLATLLENCPMVFVA